MEAGRKGKKLGGKFQTCAEFCRRAVASMVRAFGQRILPGNHQATVLVRTTRGCDDCWQDEIVGRDVMMSKGCRSAMVVWVGEGMRGRLVEGKIKVWWKLFI